MSKSIGQQTGFSAGISFSEKEGPQNSVAFLRGVDHRKDPKGVTLNPRAELDSGSVVTGLPMWGARACLRTFAYDNAGSIYQKTTGSWSKVHTASNSQGNGLVYFTADKALYYAQNTSFGRLLDACTGSSFYDDFLGSEGGDPTNTKSLDLEASSSQYASRADTASTSITADLTLEAYLKPESLPTTGNTMTIISKWDENTDLRSYKMDIITVSNFFGDGSDGVLTISSNTTEAPVDSTAAGTQGTYSLSATNASFASGQRIMIHQTRGTNAGTYQLTEIASYTAGTITTTDPLDITFITSGNDAAQVRVMPQYTNVTINAGATYSAKAWDGSVGGILGFYANGTVTVTGEMTASEKGFRGGARAYTAPGSDNVYGTDGESYSGVGSQGDRNPNNGGGGGGYIRDILNSEGTGGGGGAHSTEGTTGGNYIGPTPGGLGGNTYGVSNLTTPLFGSGGGGGGMGDADPTTSDGNGQPGGGILAIFGATITGTGTISNNGAYATTSSIDQGGGGAGAGGSNLFKSQDAIFTNLTITANGGGNSGLGSSQGGAGGDGYNHCDYNNSIAGTTTPSLSSSIDTNLGSSDGYALRLQISDDGSTVESYTQVITDQISTGDWARWQISWENTTSTANFYRNGTLLGTKTGSMTSIHDNASKFAIGCDFNSSAQNFYDGLIDDVRVWNDVRTTSELLNNNDQTLFGTEANLIAYYEFTDNVNDSQTSGNNDLTASGSPVYSTDVPFSGLTSRNDSDQGLTSGSFTQSYSLTTAIDEGATHRQSFTPTKDPQKSIIIDIDTIGSGDWTLTVHDSLNREVASKTITNGELYTGFYEFIFDSVWRPVIGAEYHFHITSTVADGAVDTTGAGDLETAYFTTHFQILISDEYHPMKEFLDFMVIGNERYLAKFEAGSIYDPHRLTFPSGYRVRCLAYWREYLVIGCWKGTNITDFDDGRIFFWDGVSTTYNHSIPVPEGGVNSMFGTQDVLFMVAGYTGEILVYNGGGVATKFNKIPKLEYGKYVEIAPGSMDMWRSNIHMGINFNTDSSSVHKGVYSIGSANTAYPASLGLDFPTSLGDQTSSNVKVGMVFPSGQSLYVGWQNGTSYGIDKISPTNNVQSTGTVECLITDLGQISKEKYPLKARLDFKPLLAGESLRVKYKADRELNWKSSVYEDTASAKSTFIRIPERMKEIQVAADLKTTVATSPTLLGISIVSEMEESSGHNE